MTRVRGNHPVERIPKDRALKGSATYDPMKNIGADYWEWKAERVKDGKPSIARELGYMPNTQGSDAWK